MSGEEVRYFLENGILVSCWRTRQFIARDKRYVLDGAFKDCISRGRKWKKAFATKEEADRYIAKEYGRKAYSYACPVHGYHISMKDKGSVERGWLKPEDLEM